MPRLDLPTIQKTHVYSTYEKRVLNLRFIHVHTPRYPKMKDLKLIGFRRVSFYFIDCFLNILIQICVIGVFLQIYDAKFQCLQPFQELEGEKSDGKGKI